MKRRRDTECPKRCDRQRVRFLRQENGDQVLDLIRTQAFQLVFLDLNMPLKNGLAVLKEIPPNPGLISPEVIVVTANDTLDHAIECIRHGASDFLSKPFDVEHLRAIARRSEERVYLQRSVAELEQQLANATGLGSIWGISQPMIRLFENIQRAGSFKPTRADSR